MVGQTRRQGRHPHERARMRGIALGVAIVLSLALPAGASTARHVLAEAFTATW